LSSCAIGAEGTARYFTAIAVPRQELRALGAAIQQELQKPQKTLNSRSNGN
jgi:hypothetical protein